MVDIILWKKVEKNKVIKLSWKINIEYVIQVFQSMYSSVPNRHACTIINFGGKSPTYMTLFGPTHLLILRNFSNLHVYSILQAYWFWRFFPTYIFIPPYIFIDFWLNISPYSIQVPQIEEKSIQLVRGSFVKKWLLLKSILYMFITPYRFINFLWKIQPTGLFHPTHLLIFHKKSSLQD